MDTVLTRRGCPAQNDDAPRLCFPCWFVAPTRPFPVWKQPPTTRRTQSGACGGKDGGEGRRGGRDERGLDRAAAAAGSRGRREGKECAEGGVRCGAREWAQRGGAEGWTEGGEGGRIAGWTGPPPPPPPGLPMPHLKHAFLDANTFAPHPGQFQSPCDAKEQEGI